VPAGSGRSAGPDRDLRLCRGRRPGAMVLV